jgi:hypothetical protein
MRRAIERPKEKEARENGRKKRRLAGLSSTDLRARYDCTSRQHRSVLWRARLAGRGALHPSIFYFLFNSDSALDLYTKYLRLLIVGRSTSTSTHGGSPPEFSNCVHK